MIEYLNTPALLVLMFEALVFMTVMNIILVVMVMKRNSKTAQSLNTLVSEIKTKSEEQKEKITELLLHPELLDPEAIKKSMQQLASGQIQLYKHMIKAIRTQKEEDVVALGNSVTGLVDSALKLGYESGEGSVDKEAQVRLEKDNKNLQLVKGDLKKKLDETSQEMEMLSDEYNRMANNANSKAKADNEEQSTDSDMENDGEKAADVTADSNGPDIEGPDNDSITGSEENMEIDTTEEDQALLDIAGEMQIEEEMVEDMTDEMKKVLTDSQTLNEITDVSPSDEGIREQAETPGVADEMLAE